MHYTKSLFIFRRDLRLHDNTALIKALTESVVVIPCFIFDPRQINHQNKFKSDNALQFMIESLKDLNKQLQAKNSQLFLFHGIAEKTIEQLIDQLSIEALYINRDYTPFSLKRDTAIHKICIKYKCAFITCEDALLNSPDIIKNKSKKPYTRFTPFYKRSIQEKIVLPQPCKKKNFYQKRSLATLSAHFINTILKHKNIVIHLHGGTQRAARLMQRVETLYGYSRTHNIPSLETSNLSAHLKFGTISIRTIYHTFKKKLGSTHPLLRQLYWRDFFTHVAYHNPFVFGQPFHQKYKNLWWSTDKKKFNAWCKGETGFPIVDAGMRQLNKTGYMHNRVRMIVASFLTKDLHINWQWGERYFAQKLVDYDPCLNNGNWQWCASTGCDAQPYFRIFNPWLQQKKFDPECTYIKRWIPELEPYSSGTIHNWFNNKYSPIKNYPKPIVDHTIESKKAKIIYQESL